MWCFPPWTSEWMNQQLNHNVNLSGIVQHKVHFRLESIAQLVWSKLIDWISVADLLFQPKINGFWFSGLNAYASVITNKLNNYYSKLFMKTATRPDSLQRGWNIYWGSFFMSKNNRWNLIRTSFFNVTLILRNKC